MKKYIKFIAVVLLAVSAYFLYTYELFDDKPFDDLKAGEIVSANIIESDRHTQITNIGDLSDLLDDLELEKRVYKINPELQKGQITIEITFTDGTSTTFTVDNTYIHTEKGTFLADSKENIAVLRSIFKFTLLDNQLSDNWDKDRVNELVTMAVEGKSWEDIRDWAKSELLDGILSEDMLKSFANQGYSPIDIYALTAEYRQRMESQIRYNNRQTQYKLLTEQIWTDYKNSSIKYENQFKRPPADFVFGDISDKSVWDNMEFQQDEMGYFYTTISSADGKYYMSISIDDNVYQNMFGTIIDNDPFVRSVSFYLQSDFGVPADYPAVDVIKNENALVSADILTAKLTTAIRTSSTPESPAFNYQLLICRLNYIEDTQFCYYNIFPLLTDKGVSQFKATNMNKVIHQIFGDYAWNATTDYGTPPNGGYNENTKSFEFSTDFGWGLMFYCVNGDINSQISADGKQVYSEFEMLAPDSSSGDPGHKSIGNYRLIYDVISENGETFLRFNRYEKA